MQLDPTRATDSDNAWAAFSGGHTQDLDRTELEETAELLSAWAISRGFWKREQYEEVQDRARRAGIESVDIDAPSENTQNISELLVAGTRIAFTGRNNLLGGPADDARLIQLCNDRQLEYKTGVSKTRCDVLVAADPASMSGKAQNAREYGKPIISQDDFENWYHNGPFLNASEVAPSVEEVSDTETRSEVPTDLSSPARILEGPPADEVSEMVWVKPEEFFQEGTRVVFRGSTYVNGERYAQGFALQSLCDSLGLDYKQAVTKTRSDVLVTDDPQADDGKMALALRYDKPLMRQEDFSAWAAERLTGMNGEEILVEEQVVVAALPTRSETPAVPVTVPAVSKVPTVPEPVMSVNGMTVVPEPSIILENKPQIDEITAPSVEPDPTPQELMNRAMEHQLQAFPNPMNTWQPSAQVPQAVQVHTPQVPERGNKAASRFKKWGIATGIVFAVSNVLGIAGMVNIGAAGVVASFFMVIAVMIFGIQALIYRGKKK